MTEKGFARPSMFAVFRNRSFSLLWIGQLISGMGSALTTLASSLLVVDDNRVNRLLLIRGLEQQGHEVASAENGKQGASKC
jgi:hypothetical protein